MLRMCTSNPRSSKADMTTTIDKLAAIGQALAFAQATIWRNKMEMDLPRIGSASLNSLASIAENKGVAIDVGELRLFARSKIVIK